MSEIAETRDRRPLPRARQDRLRRDGGRLLRRGHAPRPARSRSSCCTGASRRTSEFVERFRREASSAAGAAAPERRRRLRPRRVRRHLLHRDGVLRGRVAQGGDHARGAARPARGRSRSRSRSSLAARFAHRRNVIHRDLKPHNVILDEPTRHVKVTDFGIARAGASDITEVGAIMGTAQYLSPEQAQGQPVTEASDLYSIGVVLFEMLTGRAPFDGDSAVAVALKHVNQPPPSPRELVPEVPPRARGGGAEGAREGPGAALHGRGLVHRATSRPSRRALRRGPVDTESTAVFAPGAGVRRSPTPPRRRRSAAAGRRRRRRRGRRRPRRPASRRERRRRRCLVARLRGCWRRSRRSCSALPPARTSRPGDGAAGASGRRSTARAQRARRRGLRGRHRAPRRTRRPPTPCSTRSRAPGEGRQGLDRDAVRLERPEHRQGAGRGRAHRARRAAPAAAARPAPDARARELDQGAGGHRDPVRPRAGRG